MGFVLGAAVGYVMGAKAGRERYEQIMRTYHRIADHPAVQSAAGVAREKVTSTIMPNRNGGRPERDRVAEPPPVTSIPRA